MHAVGTPHSIHGTTRALWDHNRGTHNAAVEPVESVVLSGGDPGSHNIDGIGIGFIPPLLEPDLVNEKMGIPTAEAKGRTQRLAQEEGFRLELFGSEYDRCTTGGGTSGPEFDCGDIYG